MLSLLSTLKMGSNSFLRNGGKFLRDQSSSRQAIQQSAARENLRSIWRFNMPMLTALNSSEDHLRALFHLHRVSSVGYNN